MSRFLSKSEESSIVKAIEEAEKMTSGEIRVHIETKCPSDPVKAAISKFEELEMHLTRDRNGVLIYIAVSDQKLAIVGDKGINEVVPNDFWNKASEFMGQEFKKGTYAQGIIGAIGIAGKQLAHFFPFLNDDSDELSNEISFGK